MRHEAEVLFYEVADFSPRERELYYGQNQIPADIRAEVESLLRHDTDKKESLTSRVAASADELLRTSATGSTSGTCGPYRLIHLLGHGGMGAVYLAQRADGEVDQRVAIKLLRHGADQETFRQRFLRERQILASLSHPGIARLVDAGHTSEGQPYLAMDYIDGSPIDVYAKELDVRGKLRLFVEVCEAVAYAHRNLIVHRDLKPSNILVDGTGQPKLLDFGIAKILDTTMDQTQTRERMLTPHYASPEQVRGMAQSTATDIYSLGAVLYKLLTGRSPHEFTPETPGDVEVAICSREAVTASRLDPSVPRDLDFVLRKALRKEPRERYVSVDALADDIRAFLEWRPVRARSGNAWYRTRKFVRRYWLPVMAASLTIAGLSIGMQVANRERAVAQRRFQQVRQLANRLFTLDSDIRGLPGSTKARLGIVATAKEYLEALSAEAGGDRDLAFDIAGAYLALAHIQGVPIHSNLGQYAEAEESLRKADALIEPILAGSPADRRLLLKSAEIARSRMIVAESSRRNGEALQHADRAATRLTMALRRNEGSSQEKMDGAMAFVNIAQAQMNMHRFGEAAEYVNRGIGIARELNSTVLLGRALSLKANVLRQTGNLEDALAAIGESRSLIEKGGFEDDKARRLSLYAVDWREGMILGADEGISLDRPAEAMARFQSAFDLMEELAVRDSNDTASRGRLATAGRELCRGLRHIDPKRALALCDHSIRRLKEIANNVKARRDEAGLLALSSYPLRRLGRLPEAGQRIEAAFLLLRNTKDYPIAKVEAGGEVYYALRAEADHLAQTQHPDRAMEAYRELLHKITISHSVPRDDLGHANDLSRIYKELADLCRRNGRVQEAMALDGQRAELWRYWNTKVPNNSFVIRQLESVK